MIKRFSELSIEQLARFKGYNIGPVYHGTNTEGITEFIGGWWSDNPKATKEFGPFIYTAFLKMNNPIEDIAIDTSDDEKTNLYKEYELFVGLNLTREQIEDEHYVSLKDEAVDGSHFTKFLQEKGYDGLVVFDDSNNIKAMSFVPFKSSQIKLADPITYDDNGNPIPLSERFNYNNQDIRY